jgi:hypothetical protein
MTAVSGTASPDNSFIISLVILGGNSRSRHLSAILWSSWPEAVICRSREPGRGPPHGGELRQAAGAAVRANALQMTRRKKERPPRGGLSLTSSSKRAALPNNHGAKPARAPSRSRPVRRNSNQAPIRNPTTAAIPAATMPTSAATMPTAATKPTTAAIPAATTPPASATASATVRLGSAHVDD